MQPIAPLMIEHRLIERMIVLMDRESQAIKKQNVANVDFLRTVIDFLRTYADRCHHGKEEDILFKALAEKPLFEEHKKILSELINEHIQGRRNVHQLCEATESYAGGKQDALKEMVVNLDTLIKFYPKHIEKEDLHFFVPVMDYFSEMEKSALLVEMNEFDRKLIHERYSKMVATLESHKTVNP